MANQNSSNQLVVPGATAAIDQMKYEIAQEFGVQLGADSTARANGSVGGEITKRLVAMAEQSLGGFKNKYIWQKGLKAYALRPSLIYCNICKNFFVRSSFGFVNTSSGIPCSTTTPPSMKITRFAI